MSIPFLICIIIVIILFMNLWVKHILPSLIPDLTISCNIYSQDGRIYNQNQGKFINQYSANTELSTFKSMFMKIKGTNDLLEILSIKPSESGKTVIIKDAELNTNGLITSEKNKYLTIEFVLSDRIIEEPCMDIVVLLSNQENNFIGIDENNKVISGTKGSELILRRQNLFSSFSKINHYTPFIIYMASNPSFHINGRQLSIQESIDSFSFWRLTQNKQLQIFSDDEKYLGKNIKTNNLELLKKDDKDFIIFTWTFQGK